MAEQNEKSGQIVGLTGGISTGKTTASSFFSELGVPVVDADVVSRELVEKGQPALEEIRETFGDEVIAADGTLDRDALGKIVFADDDKRHVLNRILHPKVALRSQALLAELRQEHPYVIYDAALLVENGLYSVFYKLIVVTVSPEVQLQRLITRDATPEADAKARIASQVPLSKKEALADYLIENNGTVEELKTRVAEVHEAILETLS